MIKKEKFEFTSIDNKTMINAFKWIPEKKPKAVIQLIHGMVEYIDRYDEFARFLANKGFLVVGHDHLGHGDSVNSNDDYGYFGDNPCDLLIKDIHKIREMFDDDLPYIMIGHSMGSFLLRTYLSLYGKGVDGAIIIGTGYVPSIATYFGMAVAHIEGFFLGKKHRSKLLVKLSSDKNYKKFCSDGSNLEDSWLTKDTKIVKDYFNNSKCQFIFTDNGYLGLFKAINYCCKKKNINKIPKNLSILFASGSCDPVGGMEKGVKKVFKLFEESKIMDVTLKLYPNDRHEILNETDRVIVYNDILKWINHHIM